MTKAMVTISAKVEEELKKKLQAYGVSLSGVVRKALQDELKRIEEEELKRCLAEASVILKGVEPERIVEVIRRSREERGW